MLNQKLVSLYSLYKNCADENAVVVCPDGKDCKLEPSGLSSLVMCFNGITIEAAINWDVA